MQTKNIKSVAIVGAGAMGAAYASMFSEADGFSPFFQPASDISHRRLGKTSMLQDIEAGRKTEVDIFAGKIVAMGKEHDIPTPVNQTILLIIRAMENRNIIDAVDI